MTTPAARPPLTTNGYASKPRRQALSVAIGMLLTATAAQAATSDRSLATPIGAPTVSLAAAAPPTSEGSVAANPDPVATIGRLGEITVIGTREALDRIPGSGDVLDRELLEASRAFTINEALRTVPGVVARDEEGFGLRPNIGIRGLNPTRSTKVLLLEDGLPLTFAPYGDNASYYHPPIERFDRIEVLKGSGQILFGPQTVGAVINYLTPRAPDVPTTKITASGGNLGFSDVHVETGATFGDTGVLFHATQKAFDGSRDNQRFRVGDYNLKLTQALGASQDLTFRASYYDEDSDASYSGLTLAEYRDNPRQNPFVNDTFESYRWSASLTHGWQVNEGARLQTSVYTTYFNRDWWRQSSNSSQRPNDASDPACGGMANLSTTCGNEGRLRQYATYGVEPRLTLDSAFGLPGETQVGVRYHVERQDRLQINGDTPTARTPGVGVNGGIREDNSRDVEALAAFAQVRFDIGAFGITPGVRIEQIDFERTNHLNGTVGRTDLTEVVPGLGVTYALGSDTTLFAGAHRGFAPPRVEDIIGGTGASVDLDAELSWNYEFGLRTALRRGLDVEAALFRMDFENQIVPASVAGGVGATLTSAGETIHQGVEFGLAARARELFDGA